MSSTLTRVEDEMLIGRVAAGDPAALGLLVDRFYSPIERYLFHACGSKEDAEDLACQTFLKVRRDAHRLISDSNIKAWIYRVAHREFLMWRRRELLMLRFNYGPIPKDVHPAIGEIVVAQALSRLPTAQREAFLLVEVEMLSVEEASIALKTPPGTVKSRCFHARRRLREFLASTYPEIAKNAEPAID